MPSVIAMTAMTEALQMDATDADGTVIAWPRLFGVRKYYQQSTSGRAVSWDQASLCKTSCNLILPTQRLHASPNVVLMNNAPALLWSTTIVIDPIMEPVWPCSLSSAQLTFRTFTI